MDLTDTTDKLSSADSQTINKELQRELVYTLLVELLSYQFASPVRWIETQKSLLADLKALRLIEIGPSDTLLRMAKRTVENMNLVEEPNRKSQRRFLCTKQNSKEIYYEPDELVVPEESKPSKISAHELPDTKAKASPPETTPAAPATKALDPSPSQVVDMVPQPLRTIPDVSISALDIILAIVATKLKKKSHELAQDKSIKALTGGRSTLENEIIGDLSEEFGSLPDGAEDVQLGELAAKTQASFGGALGKKSISMINRMSQSKFVGGYTIDSARQYLQSNWGLGEGWQDKALLQCTTLLPGERFQSEEELCKFLEGGARRCLSDSGLELISATVATGSPKAVTVSSDPAAFEALNQHNSRFIDQQMHACMDYLQIEVQKDRKEAEASRQHASKLQSQLDAWTAEHGETYMEGIQPQFSVQKIRNYDSSWAWALEDCMQLYFDILRDLEETGITQVSDRCGKILSRMTARSEGYLKYTVSKLEKLQQVGKHKSPHLEQVLDIFSKMLHSNLTPGIDQCFRKVELRTQPLTVIDQDGVVSYVELPRMTTTSSLDASQTIDSKDKFDVVTSKNPTFAECDLSSMKNSKVFVEYVDSGYGGSETSSGGDTPNSSSRTTVASPSLLSTKKDGKSWSPCPELSRLYETALEKALRLGCSYEGRNVLVTGAGSRSIGSHFVRGLLQGGARVVVTTSSFRPEVAHEFELIFREFGAKGSQLTLIPFNQASKQDVVSLVDNIYRADGLNRDLDAVIPFAALSENGRQIDDIDDRSELAHRIMLTNTIRLIGEIKKQKEARGYLTRPTQVILPLSPNHGTIGSDGLYAESKLGLESIFNKWHSEGWKDLFSIHGVIIGWTRGTALMSANDTVAASIERLGCRTFTTEEMASSILGLMNTDVADYQCEPVLADFSGGMSAITNLKEKLTQWRQDIARESEIKQFLKDENSFVERSCRVNTEQEMLPTKKVSPRPAINLGFPKLPDYENELVPLSDLQGTVDLGRIVVVTGFAEIGPWGSARTRWQMEADGSLSVAGYLELSWSMGLIKFHQGPIKGQSSYLGWVDTKTNEPLPIQEVKARFESHIIQNCGIRKIDPSLFDGYDPERKQLLQEVILQHDLEPFTVSLEVGEGFAREHGDKVVITSRAGSDDVQVQFKKGAAIMLPKAIDFDRQVAGQIPKGWSAKAYGIDEDIISQVDPVTLYALVNVVEALISSGITDPYELYQHIHVSDIGNCLGSGLGGLRALRKLHKDRFVDKTVQNDILQESFINTTAAWINMLLISSSGPIRTPTGACATAVESLDLGYDTIVSGKAKVCLVGGFDDFGEDPSYEFANMKATVDSVSEEAAGRGPGEMSRPTSTSRHGFMESQGAGVQIITSAKLAIEMGLPIYGIVAWTGTASDKIGRSVPSPGRGILTSAVESASRFPNPLLNLSYRKRLIRSRFQHIEHSKQDELDYIKSELKPISARDEDDDTTDLLVERSALVEAQAMRQKSDVLYALGNTFWHDQADISPIRGALATFGLTVDDLSVASFHGTSTKKNDVNESSVIHAQLAHLDRTKGNPVLVVAQKYLTGHSKGAAGAWQVNGGLQMLASGLVPGNRNLDNVDAELEQFDHLAFLSKTLRTDGLKAFSVTSFGFGQKGAQAICVHPRYVLGMLDRESYAAYATKTTERQAHAKYYFESGMARNKLFVAKDVAPYDKEGEEKFLLDPNARYEGKLHC